MTLSFRLIAIATVGLLLPITASAQTPFISPSAVSTPVASTVPGNGDVNPYGVVVVPAASGDLVAGNILVSNFNASSNMQGTGTTIVQISPGGASTLFAQITSDDACTGGVGLTTALAVVQSKFVVVGSLPTSDGTSATAKAGCLIVLDDTGAVVSTFTGFGINGPWDMTAIDQGDKSLLFVTNVLNGTVGAGGKVINKGTVLRLTMDFSKGAPRITKHTIIGDGFPERTDPAALVIGPTGVALGSDGTLYVADTLASRIAAIPNALKRGNSAHLGGTIAQGGALFAPLGLAIAPTNGDILTVNANDGSLVETTTAGTEFAPVNLDTTAAPPADPGAGSLFGLAIAPNGAGVYFVDDLSNTLNLLH
jgi:hypothetical protein